ncbi:MAG: PilW family protein, partial [Burkholderiales bacterium]
MSQNDRGFTLIELMVAMTIGLMLTLVVANLFLGSRATFQTTDETSRMQENIRYAYQLLTRSI